MNRAPTPAELEIIKHVAGHVRYSGMTEREIAKETSWHLKRVQRLLAGETKISAEDIWTLADVLRKPVGDLFPKLHPRKTARRAA